MMKKITRCLLAVAVLFALGGLVVLRGPALAQGSGELHVYKGQLPELASAIQETIDGMSVEARPRLENGYILLPKGISRRELGAGLAETARELGKELLSTNDILDLESLVFVGSDRVLLRIVVGRHGRDGDVVGSDSGEDGISVEGIVEQRATVMLLVSGGNGGHGRCGAGGKGGNAKAFSTSHGGVLIALSGNGGSAGATSSRACIDTLSNGKGNAASADASSGDGLPNGPPGGNGGDANAQTTECQLALVSAEAGHGGNGILPISVGGPGGSGGAGGFANADCGPSPFRGICQADATGGNAGHGASGGSAVHIDGGAGGNGGAPSGGNAIAISCCDTRGDANAVAGSGGHGGNGGNSIDGNGGPAGNGSGGGNAIAIVNFGIPGGTGAMARAVAGNGGNGGNGGNVDGPAGLGAPGGVATALNLCGGMTAKVDGAAGVPGVNGNPFPATTASPANPDGERQSARPVRD